MHLTRVRVGADLAVACQGLGILRPQTCPTPLPRGARPAPGADCGVTCQLGGTLGSCPAEARTTVMLQRLPYDLDEWGASWRLLFVLL